MARKDLNPNAGTPTERVRVTPKTLERDRRLEKALELRLYGLDYQQIADTPWDGANNANGTLYCDRHAARRAIVGARNDTIREAADEVRLYELARLDKMWAGLVDAGAFDGNIDAVKAALTLQARRAKLLGLDAPTQIESSGDGVINVSFTDKLKPGTGMAEPELDVDLPDA